MKTKILFILFLSLIGASIVAFGCGRAGDDSSDDSDSTTSDSSTGNDSTTTTVTGTGDATVTSSMADGSTTNSTEATFTFSCSSDSCGFECSTDGGSFGSCDSPLTLTGLADGDHSLCVKVTGEADSDCTNFTWTVDATAPANLTYSASRASGSTTATIVVSSNDSGATYEWNLDGGGWTACSGTTCSVTGIGMGSRETSIRATDQYGNVSDVITPMTAGTMPLSPTINITTTLYAAPNKYNRFADLIFTFASTTAGATYECALDSATLATCTSPYTISATWASGDHTLTVRATDSSGNKVSLTTDTFKGVSCLACDT